MKKSILIFLSVCMVLSVLSVIPVYADANLTEAAAVLSVSSNSAAGEISETTSVSSGTDKKYVLDYLDVLTDSEENILEQKLKSLSDKYNMDFVFLSVLSAGHNDYDRIAYADDTYDYGGYRTDGVLYMYEQESTFKYISTSGKCIYALDGGERRDYDANSYIIDDILDELDYNTDYGRYYESVIAFIDKMDYYIGYYTENGSTYRYRSPYPTETCIFLSVIVGLIVTLVRKSKEKNKLKSVASNPYAGDYIMKNGLNIKGGNDIFLYSTVSRTPRQTQSSSRGGGGGVHSHSGSSGASHGGGGRH